MIVIYDHNDNGLYHKTTIVANLALARNINYDCKVRCKLERTFMIVNCNSRHLQYRPQAQLANIRLGQKCIIKMNETVQLIMAKVKKVLLHWSQTEVRKIRIEDGRLVKNCSTSGMYYKHITIVNDDSSIVSK